MKSMDISALPNVVAAVSIAMTQLKHQTELKTSSDHGILYE